MSARPCIIEILYNIAGNEPESFLFLLGDGTGFSGWRKLVALVTRVLLRIAIVEHLLKAIEKIFA